MSEIINKQKQSHGNMDLFRIFMMLFVIGHHYLKRVNVPMHSLTINNATYYLLTHLFIIGVNGFILMSGYFLCKKEFRVRRIITLVLWLCIYSMGLYTIFSLLGYGTAFSWRKFSTSFLPGNWWFMFPYVALLLITPFLNTLTTSLSYKKNLALIIAAFLIEVVWSSTFRSSEIDRQDGYSLYNFIFLYLLGAHVRIYKYKIKTYTILFSFISILIISTIIYYLLSFQLKNYDIFTLRSQFYDYNFITVFLCSFLFFFWFTKIKINNKFLSKIRPHVLSAYLIHSHPNVGAFLFANFLNNANYPNCQYILMRVIVFSIVTFTCSIIIDFILQLFLKKPVEIISNRIEVIINNAYRKIENFILSIKEITQ